jgi:DNA-binding FadR family transcriptional regulator
MGAPANEMVQGQPKRALILAHQLEQEIIEAGWPVGSVLGTEFELLERLSVGRGVLREAARLLEDQHIAKMRRGRGGGLVVLEPNVIAVADSIAIFLESLNVSSDDIFEARQVLDLFAVELAADRIDEKHSAKLRELLIEEKEADEKDIVGGSHRQMHAAIAEASGNPAIAVLGKVLSLLSDDLDVMRGRRSDEAVRRLADGVHRAHEAIVEALISGDGLLASHRMLKHLTVLHQEHIHQIDQPAAPTREPTTSGQTGRALARRIRRDIAKLGWPTGQNLGSEMELLERYGAGRAGLREAVRILEYHAAVEMRRGPGGGLIVRNPDGEAVVRAATLQLEYLGIRRADLFEAREALEIATLGLAIQRLTIEGRARLALTLEHEADWSALDFGKSSHNFHVIIAELSGNKTLQLFIAILVQINLARTPRRAEPISQAVIELNDRAHRRIAEAILDGDTPLARRRMRLHLRSLGDSTA